MTTHMTDTPVRASAPTAKQKTGLVLSTLFALINLPSAFFPTPDGEEGPPFSVLLVDTVLSAVALVAVVWVWRTGSTNAKRVLAASLIVVLLTALPGLFVGIPALLKTAIGAVTVLVLVALVLVFSGDRRAID